MSIPDKDWPSVVLQSVEIYLAATGDSREHFIKGLSEMGSDALVDRFDSLLSQHSDINNPLDLAYRSQRN